MVNANFQSSDVLQGSAVRLVWQASADYQFAFVLSYGADGNFLAVRCEIRSKQADFSSEGYDLPLQLAMKDRQGRDVSIQMHTVPRNDGYAGAVWCDISVPGYIFHGLAFEFSATVSGLPPQTVW